ncbi:MAG: hypothetical protein GXO37_05780 [Chloroflexi bacterium]|nr:hypothetical protein [Chloroflexota bacterium]
MKPRSLPFTARWGWVVLLAFLGLGCGNLFGMVRSVQEAKATVEALVTEAPATVEAMTTQIAPTLQAFSTPQDQDAAATPEAEPEMPAEVRKPQDVDALRTYRLRYEYLFVLKDRQETIPLITVEMSVNKDQQARQVKVLEHDSQPWEWIQIGNQAWIHSPDAGWVILSGDSPAEMTWLDEESFWVPLEEAEGWELVGRESLNGQTVRHYRMYIPQTYWAPATQETLTAGGVDAEYTLTPAGPAEGDAWVTDEGWALKYEFHLPFTAVDNNGTTHPAEVVWRQEVYDLNAAIDIQPPAEAGSGTAPIPVPAQASLTAAQPNQGMWMYTIQGMDLAAVMDFYHQQAAAGALTLEGELGGSGEHFWQATVVLPDGQRYNIIAGPQGNEVMLSIQKP